MSSDHVYVSPCATTDNSNSVTRARSKRKRFDDEDHQNVVSPVSCLVDSYHSFDASSFSLSTLIEMQSDSGVRFNNEVDFRSLSIENIDLLFPKYKRYGQNDPPLNRRRKGHSIRDFRLLSCKAQMVVIEKEKNASNLQSIRDICLSQCHGISINTLCKSDVQSVKEVHVGFRLLIAEALHVRANKIADNKKWVYGSACGVLLNSISKSDNEEAKWTLHKKHRPFAKDDVDCFYFLCAKCSGIGTNSCQECSFSAQLLRKRCIRSSKNNSDECFVEGRTRNSLMSPPTCKKKLKFLSKKINKVTTEKRIP